MVIATPEVTSGVSITFLFVMSYPVKSVFLRITKLLAP